ncbi:MAG: hypothetical protein L0Y66_20385 [Myxococcaceae bacterium]|nr:hypothetical protein [Myxococcaceae bacterium]MCI0670045.1 hypothetical protein [Myxococcaceae bacterium]
MSVRLLAAVALLGASAACIIEAPTSASSSAAGRTSATVREAPKLSLRGGANLEGKVELVGAEVEPGRPVPGQVARVTLLFKVLEEMDRDYSVFVHVEDADGRMPRMNLDHPPARGVYPTRQWRKGETVRDEFSLTLPAEAQVRGINLWWGLWHPETDTRLTLRNPDAVRHDGANRILLAQLPVAQ